MIVYWVIFLSVAMASAIAMNQPKEKQIAALWFFGFCCFVMVGFRWQVGCDWGSYALKILQAKMIYSWGEWEAVAHDVGYAFLNIWVADSGGSIVAVNTVTALITMVALVVFCKRQPNPLLALAIAVPYVVIVFYQGYTRQALAFGFELFALVVLAKSQNARFVLLILFAATFHKTAFILLPLAALASSRNKWWSYSWVGVTFLAAFFFFMQERQDVLWNNYVVADMQSSGGGIRIAMNVIPALLLLWFKDRIAFNSEEDKKLWFWMAVLSLACVPLVMLSSTATDRIALYLMPIQLFMLSRLPDLFPLHKPKIYMAILAYYFLVQFVWLNYATHAGCWLPYKFA